MDADHTWEDQKFVLSDFLQKMIHSHQAGLSQKKLGLAVPGHQKVAKYSMFVGIAWPPISICPEDHLDEGCLQKTQTNKIQIISAMPTNIE